MICDILPAMMEKDFEEERYMRRKRLLKQRQTGTIFGLLVLGVFVMGMFSWGGRVQSGEGGSVLSGNDPGERLYNQFCFGCHGVNGDGNEAANIPALNQNGIAWTKTRVELENHILDGGETMPELSGLVSPSDATLLIDYVKKWWTPEQIEAFNNNIPDTE